MSKTLWSQGKKKKIKNVSSSVHMSPWVISPHILNTSVDGFSTPHFNGVSFSDHSW